MAQRKSLNHSAEDGSTNLIDWRWIASKRIINRKFENGFFVTFDTIFDHTEDFAKSLILSPGELFIDAGAHCGMWSLQASKYYKKIIAIEPTPKTAKALRTNLRLNRIDNVEVVEAALTDSPGFQQFYRWDAGSMGNSLFREPVTYTGDYGQSHDHFTVRTVSIDSLFEASLMFSGGSFRPTMIKLDVEGAEYDAIFGGLTTIDKFHPKLFIEIHHPENEQKIIDSLPRYTWKKQHRLMQPEGKTEFYQTQMLGEWSF